MRIKHRLEKLERNETRKDLADQLAQARENNTPRPLPSKAELEDIAARKPKSFAARLARGMLRIRAYVENS